VAAPRGAGATSLLYRLESEHAARATYLALPTAQTAVAIVDELTEQLRARGEDLRLSKPRRGPVGVLDALDDQLRHTGSAPGRPWLALVDGPVPAAAAHELFGGLRDALFALPLRWIVVAPAERVGEYLAPPADVFFEEVVHLDTFPPASMMHLLELRGVSERVPESRTQEVLRLGAGMPRRSLVLARRAVLEPEQSLENAGYQEGMERRAKLSRSASALFEEMQGRGPIAAGDEGLLQRLGWSEMRVRRALQELAEAELVSASQGRATGPGRPPTVWQIAPRPPGRRDEAPVS